MNNKKNDLFLNMIYNPEFNLTDFLDLGLDPTNTGIDNIDTYRNNEKVKETFVTPTGQFDETAFQQAYKSAKKAYNVFATLDYQSAVIDRHMHDSANVFVSEKNVSREPNISAPIKIDNPLKQSSSIISIGKTEENNKGLSISEIAQGQKVYDPATNTWSDAPDDTFMGLPYFFDTLVLATWDEDGEHTDPITGKVEKHVKGDIKYNESGNPYYEKLNGRSVYDKQVLNKLDILTPEGSWINQYDFFDSDQVNEKNPVGSLLKNLALVGTMFIPGVGPWIAGLSVATQSVGLIGTLGKMFLGSDSPVFSEMEGWSRSVNRQYTKTEYAQKNTWCWENFINLVGDVVGQISEQRFLFRDAPALFKGTYGRTEKGQNLLRGKFVKEAAEKNYDKIGLFKQSSKSILEDGVEATYQKGLMQIQASASTEAARMVDDYMRKYNKIGSILSKLYMTAITTKDMYGEAKLAGASDLEATLLTLGYSAAEAWLLNTGIGEHVMPELREQSLRNKDLIKIGLRGKLGKIVEDAKKLNQNIDKPSFVKNLFNKGKQLFQEGMAASSSKGGQLGALMFAHGLGEGIEETTEELLADFSRSCYNVVKWLQDDDSRISYGDVFDRYSMSFLGGIVGGAVNAPFAGYNSIKNNGKITQKSALQEMMWIRRNDPERWAKLKKDINNTPFGSTTLSATKFTTDENGNVVYDQTNNYEESQDAEAKRTIFKVLDNLESMLKAEGGLLNDSQFLDKQTLGDLRFNDLQNSMTASKFLQDYQNVVVDIYEILNELNSLGVHTEVSENQNPTDLQKKRQEDKKEENQNNPQYQDLMKRLEEKRKLKDELITGKRASDFIGASLFEMIPAVHYPFITVDFGMYLDRVEHKNINDLPEAQRKVLHDKYVNWLYTEGKDEIWKSYQAFRETLDKSSELLTKYDKILQEDPNLKKLKGIYERITKQSEQLESENKHDESVATAKLALDFQYLLSSLIDYGDEVDSADVKNHFNYFTELVNEATTEEEEAKVNSILEQKGWNTAKLQNEDIVINYLNNLSKTIDKTGYINSEIKSVLLQGLTEFNDIINTLDPAKYDLDDPDIVENDPDAQKALELRNSVENLLSKLGNPELKESPVNDLLKEFSLKVNDVDINLNQIVNDANQLLLSKKQALSEFMLDQNTSDNIDYVLKTITLLKSALNASKTDNLGISATRSQIGVSDNTDLWGYTKTLNELNAGTKDWKKLPELTTQSANIYLSELDTIETKLKYLQNLNAINRGLKLNAHVNIDLNQQYIWRNKLQRLIATIPDDWKDKDKLESKINLETISKYSKDKKYEISLAEKIQIKKDSLEIQDAIYDFFKANSDKDLSELLNPKNFNFNSTSNKILNDKTDDLSDTAFVWYLASRAAVRASDFYGLYKQSFIDGIAPIATQELAIYTAFAQIVNNQEIERFYNAFRKGTINYCKGLSEKDRADYIYNMTGVKLNDNSKLYKDENVKHIVDFGFIPKYSRIALIEGIAGAGKTEGVLRPVVNMIKNIKDQHVLDNVIICHGTNKKSAEKTQQKLNIPNSKVQTREELMNEVNPDWVNFINKDGSLNITSDDLIEEEDPLSGFVEFKSKDKIAKSDNPPTLMIIDEISQFTLTDIDSLEKHAKENGYQIIALGDIDQSKASFKMEVNIDGEKIPLKQDLARNNFIHCPKLGASMRTDNSQKNVNQISLINFIYNDANNLTLHYYENDSGIYGDKFYAKQDSETLSDTDFEQLKKDIKKMIDTSKDEKVGFIYHSTNTPLYKWLMENYKDQIDEHKDNTAQGLESTYYIAELNSKDEFYKNNLYTAITRAQRGSIVVSSSTNVIKVDSVQDSKTQKDELNETSIKLYTKNVSDTLDKLNIQSNPIKIIDAKKVNATSNQPNKARTTYLPVIYNQRTVGFNLVQDANKAPETASNPEIVEATDEDYKKYDSIPDSITLNVNEITTQGRFVKIPFVDSENKLKGVYPILNIDGKPVVVLDVQGHALPFVFDEQWKPFFGFTEEGNAIFNENIPDSLNKELFAPIQQQLYEEIPKAPEHIPNVKLEDLTNGEPDGTLEFINKIFGDTKKSNEVTDDYLSELIDGLKDYYSNLKNNIKTEEIIITQDDVDSDEEIQEKTDLISKDDPPTQDIKDKLVEILLYSFNTFESGVTFDSSGNIVFDDERIDSMNGLHKIDSNSSAHDFDYYDNVIAHLRRYLLTTEKKSDQIDNIKEELEDALGYKLNPNDELYITYGFIKRTAPGTGSNNGKYSRFRRRADERLSHIYSKDKSARKLTRGNFAAIIGVRTKDGSKDILELPLLSLESPLTLLQMQSNGQYIYQAERTKFLNLMKSHASKPIEEQIAKSMDEFVEYLEGAKKTDTTLYYLSKLFTITQNIVVYMDEYGVKDSNGKGNKQEASEWTPVRNLNQLGPLMIFSRGENQINDELQYDANWVSLDEFAKSDNFTISHIYSSKSNLVDGVSFNAGHPFVLVTQDFTHSNLLEAYIDQEKNGGPKTIKMYEVVSPSYTLEEFIDNLREIIQNQNKNNSAKPIGQINTSYKILKKLFKQDEFKNIVTNLYGSNVFNWVNSAIVKLEALESNIKNDDPNSSTGFFDALTSEYSAPHHIFGNISRPLNQILDNFLLSLVYVQTIDGRSTEVNSSNLEYIKDNCGIENVRLRSQKPAETDTNYVYGDIFEIKTDIINGKYSYSFDGRPYLFHGKLDSVAFKSMEINIFLENLINHRLQNSNGMYFTNNTKDWYIENNSDIFNDVNKKTNENPMKEQKTLLTELFKNKGIDIKELRLKSKFDKIKSQEDLDAFQKLFCEKFNEKQNGKIAFIDLSNKNEIRISNENDILKNKQIIISTDKAGNNKTTELDPNGTYYLTLYEDNKQNLFELTLEKNNTTGKQSFILTEIVQNQINNSSINQIDQIFKDFKYISGENFFESNDFSRILYELDANGYVFNDEEEFLTELKDSNTDKQDILNIISNIQFDKESNGIKFINDLNEAINNDKDNTKNDSCEIIKIGF